MKTAIDKFKEWCTLYCTDLSIQKKSTLQNNSVYTGVYKGEKCEIHANISSSVSVRVIVIFPNELTEDILFQNDGIEGEFFNMNLKLDRVLQFAETKQGVLLETSNEVWAVMMELEHHLVRIEKNIIEQGINVPPGLKNVQNLIPRLKILLANLTGTDPDDFRKRS